MNERIKELAEQAGVECTNQHGDYEFEPEMLVKFAELIIQECIGIAKTWEEQLEGFDLIEESNAVGIVAYRIARQFGVKE